MRRLAENMRRLFLAPVELPQTLVGRGSRRAAVNVLTQ
jgi:hypothetical protein